MAIYNDTTNNTTFNHNQNSSTINLSSNNSTEIISGTLDILNVTGSNETITVSGSSDTVNITGGLSGSLDTITISGSGVGNKVNSSSAELSKIALMLSSAGTTSVNLLDSQDDTITTTSGINTISFGAGSDHINLNGGTNSVTGGNGTDTYAVSAGVNNIILGTGTNTVHLTGGTTSLNAVKGTDTIYVDYGTESNTITGGGANDSIVFQGPRSDYLIQLISGTAGSSTAQYKATEISNPSNVTFFKNIGGLSFGGSTEGLGELPQDATHDSITNFSGTQAGDVNDIPVTYPGGIIHYAPNPTVSGHVIVSDPIQLIQRLPILMLEHSQACMEALLSIQMATGHTPSMTKMQP